MKDNLILESVSKSFGGVRAVDNVSLSFPEGKITAIVGSNGAGKTTLFNLITGALKPDSGSIVWKGTRINGIPSWVVSDAGIGRLFQDVRVFKKFSAMENVMTAFRHQAGESVWKLFTSPRWVDKEEERYYQTAKKLLDFVGLGEKENHWAETLSFGQQKLLALSRLLANEAELLLLDEPTAGISREMTSSLGDLLRRLVREGKTVILIEHDIDFVKDIADSIIEMEDGKIIGQTDRGQVSLGSLEAEAPTLKAFPVNALTGSVHPLLQTKNLHLRYGKRGVIHNASLSVKGGEIVSVFGHNGVGKSTFLRAISGYLLPQQGHVFFDNQDVTTLPPHIRQRLGIVYFMQGGHVFPSLTVSENLELARTHSRNGIQDTSTDIVLKTFPDILEIQNKRAGLLSGGQRQALALSMALLQKPKILLLDEPTAGLSHDLSNEFFVKLSEIVRDKNIAAVVVEQHIKEASSISDRCFYITNGRFEEIQKDTKVVEKLHLAAKSKIKGGLS